MVMPLPPDVKFRDPTTLIATWFGCGLMRPAPGSWGSIGALPFGIIFLVTGGPAMLAIASILLFLLGIWATKAVLKKSGADHDPQIVVVDEVVGQWIALIPAALSPLHILLAFCFFRAFDVLKPWPICWLDRKVPGAYGVMLDDVAAGVLAAFCLIVARYAGVE